MEFDRVGKYQILHEIGRGTMGRVFKAQDPVLGRFVAVKTLSYSLAATEESRKRFHREAQAAAVLSHPNIVTVHDFGEEKGLIYMAMELLEGKDLRDALVDGDLATLDDKLRVMEQVMAGLSFAHSKGVIHRDLKPANIHIQPGGQVKIVDFGLARLSTSEMTQDGIVLGTPNYMSPEQALGDKIDARSDVFAAGAVFYEALTGCKPFDAESTPGVLFQVVHKQPRAVREVVPEIPQILAEVVEKALIKDKTKRFQSARQMRAALSVARQALEAGRGPNATLAEESQRAFREAMKFEPPKAAPDASAPPTFVHGSTALDVEVAPAAPPSGNLPRTLSGRAPLEVDPGHAAQGAARSSVLPLVLGGLGLVVVVGIGVGYVILNRALPPAPPASPTPTSDPSRAQVGALTQALVESRLKLAERDLEDKNYGAAIDQADSILKLDGRNAEARQIRARAAAKKEEVEAAASEAQAAADLGDTAKASAALNRLLELDPRHPAAATLSERLNSAFKSRAEEASQFMARARGDAESAKAAHSEAFAKADSTAREAGTRLQQGDFAEATRGFLAARDDYDRARRAAKAPTPAPSGPAPIRNTPSAAPVPPTPEPTPAVTSAAPMGPSRAFFTGKTQIAGARSGGGVEGFDTADVKTRRSPDCVGHLEFEATPLAVKAGDTLTLRVFVVNEGTKLVRVRSVALTLTQNGTRSSLPTGVLGRDIAPLQKVAVAETRTVWPDGVSDWSLDVVVTSDRDETGTCRLTWQ
jgi:tetratricopeptide (TPR) repeat protein/predicted Ser/Thr protein kinase